MRNSRWFWISEPRRWKDTSFGRWIVIKRLVDVNNLSPCTMCRVINYMRAVRLSLREISISPLWTASSPYMSMEMPLLICTAPAAATSLPCRPGAGSPQTENPEKESPPQEVNFDRGQFDPGLNFYVLSSSRSSAGEWAMAFAPVATISSTFP